jgi:hypothetical protein
MIQKNLMNQVIQKIQNNQKKVEKTILIIILKIKTNKEEVLKKV